MYDHVCFSGVQPCFFCPLKCLNVYFPRNMTIHQNMSSFRWFSVRGVMSTSMDWMIVLFTDILEHCFSTLRKWRQAHSLDSLSSTSLREPCKVKTMHSSAPAMFLDFSSLKCDMKQLCRYAYANSSSRINMNQQTQVNAVRPPQTSGVEPQAAANTKATGSSSNP